MKKTNIVRSNIEFNDIINTGKLFKNKYYVIYVNIKEKEKYRVGISVPKKIGNAVIRNKVKRKIKSIVDNNKIKINNFDYIIIARNLILNLKYKDMEKGLIELLDVINKENKL